MVADVITRLVLCTELSVLCVKHRVLQPSILVRVGTLAILDCRPPRNLVVEDRDTVGEGESIRAEP